MNTSLHLPLRRLAVALVLGLGMAGVVAAAGDTTDVTEIDITANGRSEHVVLENLAVGESRQLYSAAGTLVTATRTADAIELDIGGEKTVVRMPEAIDDDAIAAFVRDAGAGDGGKRVIRLQRSAAGDAATVDVSGEGSRVLVLSHKDGDLEVLDGDDVDALLDSAGTDGKRVIVKRKRVLEADAGDAVGK